MVNIAVIEDDLTHVAHIENAFRQLSISTRLTIFNDGKKAMHFFEEVLLPYPDFILLDLNLPKVNGKEILLFLKNHSELKKIPVIIFSASTLPTDVTSSYLNLANSYIKKPSKFEGYVEVFKRFESFWFSQSVQLPNK